MRISASQPFSLQDILCIIPTLIACLRLSYAFMHMLTLAMVKRYAHLSKAHIARVVARMNATISGGG